MDEPVNKLVYNPPSNTQSIIEKCKKIREDITRLKNKVIKCKGELT